MEGIARRAEEGQQLLHIENGGNMIKELAKQNGTPPPAQLGMRFRWQPYRKSKRPFQPGTLNINVTPQKPIYDVNISNPQFTTTHQVK